jgi:hypothetical protein
MMSDLKWRFPGNGYTEEHGIDTADMETFKKDPIASLARELCQNSIDARRMYDKPVTVHFNSFCIPSVDIPDVDRLRIEIQSCRREWIRHRKISAQLEEMENAICRQDIECLRISDFNTKGLTGVGGIEKKSWYLLTKGSGISDKEGTRGGSKGIGKFATFVASEFNTVFYSTITVENEQGFQGICKLCSTSIEGSDEKTIGTGYYGIDSKNNPLLSSKSLDPSFKRENGEFGTDIYIIGFRKEASWKREIITKVLDSFMAAIVKNELVVKVDDVIIDNLSVESVISSENFILKRLISNIKSQYYLLTNPSVHKEPITIDGYGDALLYIKGFGKEDIDLATNNCVMIRYPYMKIRTYESISSIPCSALCIINDNTLNSVLRDIENPQHTDWELKRVTDTSKRQEIQRIISELRNKILEIAKEYLTSSENAETDIEGASDYLPESGDHSLGEKKAYNKRETTRILPPRKNKIREEVGIKENQDPEAFMPDIGSITEGEGVPKPQGQNESQVGKPTDSDVEGKKAEGENDILLRERLSGIKYRFFVLNKDQGLYAVVFDAPFDEHECELELYLLDDSGITEQLTILEASVNGNALTIQNGKSVLFEMYESKRYKFSLKTNEKELFASEVRIYANR